MTKSEWIRRCSARLASAGDMTPAWARMEAQTLADVQAELHGASGAAWVAPEDAADESLAAEDGEAER